MIKPSTKMSYQSIKQAVSKLPANQRIRLLQELEKQTRQERWDQIVSKVRARAAKDSISEEEINRICEQTRQQLYEQRTQGRH